MKVSSSPDPWFKPLLRNVTSQFGEDGLIEHALGVIGVRNGWCVEFGAWDGAHLSNTHNLIVNHGYAAVLIEAAADRFQALQATFSSNPKVIALNRLVGFEGASSLDKILASTGIPSDFDLLSIDIDGNDYHVWSSVEQYRPKLVVIEFNPTIPSPVDFVQPPDPAINQGSSLLALCRLAQRKGYQLIATTACNAVFVDGVFYARFDLVDNSVDALRIDTSAVTHLFYGYDGQMHIAGNARMVWHELPLTAARLQQVPRFFRQYPGNFSHLKQKLWSWYRRLR